MKEIKGFIVKPENITEAFKAEVTDKTKMIPRKVGAAHPFNFKTAEDLYKSYGWVTGAIDKHVDSIVGDFTATAKNPNVQALIELFITDTNFQVALRQWIKQALITGNGFMELDLGESKVQVLNSNEMFVKRNTKGKVLEYNQVVGANDNRFSGSMKEPIRFEPNQIAHLKINAQPGEAYGIGIVKPNFITIDNLIQIEMDSIKLVSRKAGAPYHVKVGVPGEFTNPDIITEQASNLQFLNNATEWTTDANVDIKILDFGDLGVGFEKLQRSLHLKLLAGFQVPEVLMGSGELNEGIARVQLSTFINQRIKSLQEEIEKVIEEMIFMPLLLSQGNQQFQEHVEFNWNLPTEESINKRIEQISGLLNTRVETSENLKRLLEIEIAKVLDIKDFEPFLRLPEVGLDDKLDEEKKEQEAKSLEGQNSQEGKQESKIKQPEVPKAKPSAQSCGQHITESQSKDMTIQEWVEDPRLKELAGFTYSDYVASILALVKKDEFVDLLALNPEDLSLGLLPVTEVEKLREILKDGFKKNQTIGQMQKKIEQNVELNDRLRIKENGEKALVIAAQNRPNSIVRTETSRLANQGLLNTYKDNNIQKVQFLAALSDRTCPICEQLNSQVFTINESAGTIPVHVACRCTWIPVTE